MVSGMGMVEQVWVYGYRYTCILYCGLNMGTCLWVLVYGYTCIGVLGCGNMGMGTFCVHI